MTSPQVIKKSYRAASDALASSSCFKRMMFLLLSIAPLSEIQASGIVIVPSLRTSYDNNIFRANPLSSQVVDDLIISPNLAVNVHRQLARNTLTLKAVFGYDFYKNHESIGREHIDVAANANVKIGAHCEIAPSVEANWQKSEYGDTITPIPNMQKTFSYGADVMCQKPVGFFPKLGYSRSVARNSAAFSESDLNYQTVTAGIGYQRPSLGSALLYYSRNYADRPSRADQTRINQFGLTLSRSVSPRLSATIDINWMDVNNSNPFVLNYSGIGWMVETKFRPDPRFIVTINTKRSIVGNSLISSSYALQTDTSLSLSFQLTDRSRFGLSVQDQRRHFRGEVPILGQALRIADHSRTYGAQYSWAFHPPWRLIIDGARSLRNGENSLFDYRDTRVSLTLSRIL